MILLTGEHCIPCRAIKMLIDTLDLGNQVKVIDVASEWGKALTKKHSVRSVPTLLSDVGVITGQLNITKTLRELKG